MDNNNKSFFFDFNLGRQADSRGLGRKGKKILEGCEVCSLKNNCISPKMEPFGGNELKIMIVGEAPGVEEDRVGIPFVGASGKFLEKCLKYYGIDMNRDCVRTNVVQCFPAAEVSPGKKAINNCRPRLLFQIKKFEPILIIAMGGIAMENLLSAPSGVNIKPMKFRGRVIPSLDFGCWIGCLLHPSWVLRGGKRDEKLFYDDMRGVLEYLFIPFEGRENINENEGNIILTNFRDICDLLDEMSNKGDEVSFDYETNSLLVFEEEEFRIGLVSFSDTSKKAFCVPLGYPFAKWSKEEEEILKNKMRIFLQSRTPKIVQNEKYEQKSSKRFYGVEVNNVVYDTMLARHVLDSRKGTAGLAFQTFCETGTKYKDMVDTNQIEQSSLEEAGKYNCLDSRYTLFLRNKYMEEFGEGSDNSRALKLLMDGCRTFARMEERGVMIDEEELEKQEREVQEGILDIDNRLVGSELSRKFLQKYGKNLNYNSSKDMQKLLFDMEGIRSPKTINKRTGNYSVDEEVLERIILEVGEGEVGEFLEMVLRFRALKKRKTTYLDNFRSKRDSGGLIHPSFMLHTVETFRSSSENPNFQNIPKHDEEMRKIRKCIVPKYDYFLDADYKGAEIRVLCDYSKDVLLKKYIEEGYDFHKLWASRIFKVDLKDVTPTMKFKAKNCWVFPLFYGSWIDNIIKSGEFKEVEDGHLRDMEREFWKEFEGVKNWQKEVYHFYEKKGYVETFFGFKRFAPLSFNQVINTPIQATSFHLLLDGLVKVDNYMVENGFASGVNIQVHDDVVFDVREEEIEESVEIADKFLTGKRFDWEEVPMELSWSVGKNWLEMESLY